MSNLQVNMTKDPIVKSLVIFALPILFSNIFQQLYNTIDIMIVGNFLGDSSLAAIGASSSIYELLLGFCFGVGNGLSIVVSRYFGQGDKTLLKKSVAGSIIIALILTAILMTASSLGLYPLMRALKTPENLLAESHSYVSTLTNFYRCHVCLQSAGRTFTGNRKQLYAAGFPDYFFPDQHLAGSFIYHTISDGYPRCCCCHSHRAGIFRYSLSDLYYPENTDSGSGTAAFCGWQKALLRAYHPGTFHGLYERSGFLREPLSYRVRSTVLAKCISPAMQRQES